MTTLLALRVTDFGEEFAGFLGFGEQDAAFFKSFPNGGEAIGRAIRVAQRIVDIWYCTIVSFAQSAAREDMCRGEAGRFLDTVEQKNLVGGGNQKDTRARPWHLWSLRCPLKRLMICCCRHFASTGIREFLRTLFRPA